MPWRNFLSPDFRIKFQREVPLFLEITEFPFNTVQDRWKEAHMPKTSSIRSAVSIEHRLVTDRRKAVAIVKTILSASWLVQLVVVLLHDRVTVSSATEGTRRTFDLPRTTANQTDRAVRVFVAWKLVIFSVHWRTNETQKLR